MAKKKESIKKLLTVILYRNPLTLDLDIKVLRRVRKFTRKELAQTTLTKRMRS